MPSVENEVSRASPLQAALTAMENAFLTLQRASAGYNTLTSSLKAHTNPPADAHSHKGLPVFEFVASIDGVNAQRICCDLSRSAFDKRYVEHVMIPMINSFSMDMEEANAAILKASTEVADILKKVIAAAG